VRTLATVKIHKQAVLLFVLTARNVLRSQGYKTNKM